MKHFLTACFIVLVFSLNAFADLQYISTEESVKRSDFIVIGTLQSISNIYQDDKNGGRISMGDGEGVFVVDEIIAGNVLTSDGLTLKSGDKLHLKWNEFSACLSGWHKRTENEKGIWLLLIDKDGTVETSHPAQFASLNELSQIKKYIKKYSRKFSKTVTIQIGSSQNSNPAQQSIETEKTTTSEMSFCEYSNQPKTKYYPFTAFLVILVSGSLYYLLYRSRFKIR